MKAILRAALSAIAGYVAMTIAFIIIFTGIYLLLGTAFTFSEGSWEVSSGWVVVSLCIGFGISVGGGILAQLIDRSGKGAFALMGLIVVIGVLELFRIGALDEAVVRDVSDPGFQEAMQNAIEPMWWHYVNPLLSCLGVFVATRIVPKK